MSATTFLRFYNVRYVETVVVEDEGAAQQIRELLDEDNDASMESADSVLTDHGTVVSDDLVGDCDDLNINIEEG